MSSIDSIETVNQFGGTHKGDLKLGEVRDVLHVLDHSVGAPPAEVKEAAKPKESVADDEVRNSGSEGTALASYETLNQPTESAATAAVETQTSYQDVKKMNMSMQSIADLPGIKQMPGSEPWHKIAGASLLALAIAGGLVGGLTDVGRRTIKNVLSAAMGTAKAGASGAAETGKYLTKGKVKKAGKRAVKTGTDVASGAVGIGTAGARGAVEAGEAVGSSISAGGKRVAG